MTISPTASSPPGSAATGRMLPWRPRPCLAWSLAALAALAGVLAGCGSGQPAHRSGGVFSSGRRVSLSRLDRDIGALYRDHPAISTYVVQDVQYTVRSRATVLRECTSGSAATPAEVAESSQLTACAPLIFFLYQFGRRASVPAATTAAGELYSYAVTHITGPVDARASLDQLLHSWGLPVPALSRAQARKALRASVITAADDAILGQKSVHIMITGRRPGSTTVAERISADAGTTSGTETLESGPAHAQILVAAKAAYFRGNAAGLTGLLGLSPAAAARAGSGWVVIARGTREYADLATEDTMASLPASILPPDNGAVRLRTATIGGTKVYILQWTTQATGTSTAVGEQLVLDATRQVLPVSETTTASGFVQIVTLSQWGEPVSVTPPSSAVPYGRVRG